MVDDQQLSTKVESHINLRVTQLTNCNNNSHCSNPGNYILDTRAIMVAKALVQNLGSLRIRVKGNQW
jgi:hypothetical protein